MVFGSVFNFLFYVEKTWGVFLWTLTIKNFYFVIKNQKIFRLLAALIMNNEQELLCSVRNAGWARSRHTCN